MRENTAKAFIRVWKVMEMCYQILVQEKRATPRELFYKLLCDSSDYFTSQLQVSRTVQVLASDLQSSILMFLMAIHTTGNAMCIVMGSVYAKYNTLTCHILNSVSRKSAVVRQEPAGLEILSTFKYGSIGMGLEVYKYLAMSSGLD
ncbi:hypothetical protein POM88_021903 [Heracleum sosnowskyi]|uniref:Spo11/DNA topoisomerase VI subunit A N-terminal domain-containing protein n=1 Tax=Heracleum sosnowskyi TaxID=360622 RepID=A0AAD8MU98_9APIA|nr:hypothetical protein POM88_021903 [Heracleum sosnowskyi]